ncbi:MAG: hypothetical protein JXX28_16595 [Deltaproteobacteria bacterium]|nr:hypothetical protein [Deltaproteobacteria bacterium]
MIHTITHWSHLMRVSLMAIAARAEGARRTFEAMPWWRKGWEALKLLARVRSINPYRLAGGLSERGRRCRVHPTAVVEASILGDDVEIGPFAVVRASVIGDGAKIGEHCRVNVSSVGARAQLSRGATLNLSVMMDEAFISQGNGFQGCVFGRQAFVAWGATAFDLTFGRDIQVWHKGLRASSGVRFLGAAFGHRAKVMPHVIIGYGEEIANDGFLVADPEQVARRIPQELSSEPHVVRGGRAVPLR